MFSRPKQKTGSRFGEETVATMRICVLYVGKHACLQTCRKMTMCSWIIFLNFSILINMETATSTENVEWSIDAASSSEDEAEQATPFGMSYKNVLFRWHRYFSFQLTLFQDLMSWTVLKKNLNGKIWKNCEVNLMFWFIFRECKEVVTINQVNSKVEALMKKSVMGPGFEQLRSLPTSSASKRLLRKERQVTNSIHPKLKVISDILCKP